MENYKFLFLYFFYFEEFFPTIYFYHISPPSTPLRSIHPSSCSFFKKEQRNKTKQAKKTEPSRPPNIRSSFCVKQLLPATRFGWYPTTLHWRTLDCLLQQVSVTNSFWVRLGSSSPLGAGISPGLNLYRLCECCLSPVVSADTVFLGSSITSDS